VTSRRAVLAFGALTTTFLVAGCAVSERARDQNDTQPSSWRGRLSIRVQADPAQNQLQDQSFSAAFELQGDANLGDLLLYTPFGSTAAAIHWAPGGAVLQARGETRSFGDLAALIKLVLGTDVPVTALFAWLSGQTQEVDGWQVDLSHQPKGKIVARRLAPALPAELQLLLDD